MPPYWREYPRWVVKGATRAPLSEVYNFGLICLYRIKDNFSYF